MYYTISYGLFLIVVIGSFNHMLRLHVALISNFCTNCSSAFFLLLLLLRFFLLLLFILLFFLLLLRLFFICRSGGHNRLKMKSCPDLSSSLSSSTNKRRRVEGNASSCSSSSCLLLISWIKKSVALSVSFSRSISAAFLFSYFSCTRSVSLSLSNSFWSKSTYPAAFSVFFCSFCSLHTTIFGTLCVFINSTNFFVRQGPAHTLWHSEKSASSSPQHAKFWTQKEWPAFPSYEGHSRHPYWHPYLHSGCGPLSST